MVDAIIRGESQMRVLVKDLLDLSRLEANEFELELELVDVGKITSAVVEMMTPVIHGKFQTVEYDGPTNPVHAEGDEARLTQVITNLLSNASKYSPESTNIRLSVKAEESCTAVEVVDRGIGISKEDQQKLFTPFFRSENSETRQVPGTGLGLVICKQIVELHGGKLTLRSARDRGTTVRVELPYPESRIQEYDAA